MHTRACRKNAICARRIKISERSMTVPQWGESGSEANLTSCKSSLHVSVTIWLVVLACETGQNVSIYLLYLYHALLYLFSRWEEEQELLALPQEGEHAHWWLYHCCGSHLQPARNPLLRGRGGEGRGRPKQEEGHHLHEYKQRSIQPYILLLFAMAIINEPRWS